jgi:hypothetical protein
MYAMFASYHVFSIKWIVGLVSKAYNNVHLSPFFSFVIVITCVYIYIYMTMFLYFFFIYFSLGDFVCVICIFLVVKLQTTQIEDHTNDLDQRHGHLLF